jgi:hypothetical protein
VPPSPPPAPPPSNYRACVRSHRAALQAQKVFWQVLLHDTVAFKSLQSSFVVMNAAEKQAAQIYRRRGAGGGGRQGRAGVPAGHMNRSNPAGPGQTLGHASKTEAGAGHPHRAPPGCWTATPTTVCGWVGVEGAAGCPTLGRAGLAPVNKFRTREGAKLPPPAARLARGASSPARRRPPSTGPPAPHPLQAAY